MPALSRLNRAVVVMCAAQACAQIGAFGVAALIPTLIPAWSLSNTEAGWISGIYYAAYTLVVPLLSSLTDRVDPKRIYLGSVALTAVAFAGFAWVATGFRSALAFALVLIGLPARPPRTSSGPRAALLDFRPVLRNRSALAYSLAYCVHTWEMSALRAWVVTFLTFAAAQSAAGTWVVLAPATVASVMGLLGVWASVWGNELAIRFGRRRFILGTMFASTAMAGVIGFSAALPYAGAAALILVYAMLIWSDSSSLTAGSAGSAEPGRRGATLAVHSTLGYAGGFLGPLALGAMLDLFGGPSVLSWGIAFGHVTIALLLGTLAFVWLRPADLAGDRSMTAAVAAAPPPNRA